MGETARARLKGSILDAFGCAIGALSSEPVRRIREMVEEFGSTEQCTLIGGGRTAPDRAALTRPFVEDHLRNEIIAAVRHLETIQVADLASLLSFETNRERSL